MKQILNFWICFVLDFQYMEGPKDQGINVREKAKQLVALLKDDERLKNERARALKAKERSAQCLSGFGSDGMDTMSPVSSDVSDYYFFFIIFSIRYFLIRVFMSFLFLVSGLGTVQSLGIFCETCHW